MPLSASAPARSRRRALGWIDTFLPEDEAAPDVLVKQRLLILCSGVLAVAAALFGLHALRLQHEANGITAALWGGAVVALTYPLLLRWTGSRVVPGTLLCVEFALIMGAVALFGNGFDGEVLIWAPGVPLLAAFLVGPGAGLGVALLVIAELGGLFWMEQTGRTLPDAFTPDVLMRIRLMALVSGVLFAALLGWLYESLTLRGLRRVNRQLQATQDSLRQSEARFRGVVQEASVGIGITSLRLGRTLETNEALQRMLGYDADALAEHGLAAVTHPADRARADAALRRVLDGAGPARLEQRYLTREGAVRWGESTVFAVADADGAPAYAVVMVEDVTEQRQAEEARRHAAERVAILHAVGRAILSATSAEEIALSTLERMAPILPHVRSHVVEYDQATGTARVLATGTHGRAAAGDERRVPIEHCGPAGGCTDGPVYVADVAAAPDMPGAVHLLDGHPVRSYLSIPLQAGGEVVGALHLGGAVPDAFDADARAVAQEVADMLALALQQQRVDRRLLQAKETAEASEHLKSTLLTNMSHEVRTPLAGIMGLAEVLQEETTGEHAELAGMIRESGERLFATLDAVLDLAQLESGAMAMRPRRVDLMETVGRAAAAAAPAAARKGLRLTCRPAEPLMVRVDPSAVRRILACLLDNAVKFTDEGRIDVRVEAGREDVRIVVRDTGVGIDPAFLPHVFDAFRQESAGAARSHEGNGLGLALARQLAVLLGGTLTAASRKGAGATFTLTLPHAAQAVSAPLPA